MKVVKVTAKGQVTIPVDMRAALEIDEDTYLEVSGEGNEPRQRLTGFRSLLLGYRW